jgi:DNA-binding XRE family transcriptional regulator
VLPIYQLEIRAARPQISRQWWALKGGAKMHPQTFGEHLKKRRLELGLELDHVADRIGVTWNSVSNWERGIYRPSKRAMIPTIASLRYDPRGDKT